MRSTAFPAAAALIAGTIAGAPSVAADDPAAEAASPPPAPAARMPPPPGPGVVVERRADGTLHVDVRCPSRDAIRECAVVAGDLLLKLNVSVQAK